MRQQLSTDTTGTPERHQRCRDANGMMYDRLKCLSSRHVGQNKYKSIRESIELHSVE
jgi:hypothetical protein